MGQKRYVRGLEGWTVLLRMVPAERRCKVKAESVDMIFSNPMFEDIQNHLADDGVGTI